MRCVLDPCCAREALLFLGKEIVHCLARNEGRGAEGYGEFVVRSVVVTACLGSAGGHFDRQKRGYDGRGERVEGGVDVPAIEAGVG